MLAVLDANVVVSGLLAPAGAPADVLRALERAEFELLISPALLRELERVLASGRIRERIPPADAQAALRWLVGSASAIAEPPQQGPFRSRDPGDDHLIALAWRHSAALVSCDDDLLELRDRIPVFAPRDFLALLRK